MIYTRKVLPSGGESSQENHEKLAQVITEKIAKKEISFVSFSITFHSFKV
jgi:hypothetical protein